MAAISALGHVGSSSEGGGMLSAVRACLEGLVVRAFTMWLGREK